MPLTLKQNLDQMLNSRGFPAPDAYVGSTNPADAQMVAIANEAADDIMEGGYQRLRKTGTIAMTAATEYDLPSDFLELVPDTTYPEDRPERVDLPTTPGHWAFLRAGGITDYILRCRIMGGELHVQNPINGTDLEFEYISNTPIQTTGGGALKSRFSADTDVWLLDDALLRAEIKWRWEQAKGFADWQVSLAAAQKRRIAVRGRDAGSQTLVPCDRQGLPEPYTNLWVS